MIIKFLLILFLTVIGLKFIINLSRLIEVRWLFKRYIKWMEKYEFEMTEKKSQIVNLFKKAGILDKYISITIPKVGRHFEITKVSIFENIFYQNQIVTESIYYTFKEANGIFKRRIFDSFNPFYWIEFFIFLPKIILNFIDQSYGKKGVNIIQLIYWFFCIILSIITIFEKWPFIKSILK